MNIISIELALLVYFFFVMSLRTISLLVGEKIIAPLLFIPGIALISSIVFLGFESKLGFISFDGLKFPFLLVMTGFFFLSLLSGFKKPLVHNFFTSLHYMFSLIVIGANDFIVLTVGIVICGLVGIIHPLLSSKNSQSDFSIRTFGIFIVVVMGIILSMLSFVMATGSPILSLVGDSNSNFLLISLFFLVLVYFIESGSFTFSFIMTDFGARARTNIYPLLLMNKFLLLGTSLILINKFSMAINDAGSYRYIIQILSIISLLFSTIGGLNVRNSARLVSKLFSVNSIIVFVLFSTVSNADILYTAFIFLSITALLSAVCLDRKPVCLENLVPFYGGTMDLVAFTICFLSLSLFPVNIMFIKRLSLLVAANKNGMSVLIVLYVIALTVLFISCVNLISSVLQKKQAQLKNKRAVIDRFVEWLVILTIFFGGFVI